MGEMLNLLRSKMFLRGLVGAMNLSYVYILYVYIFHFMYFSFNPSASNLRIKSHKLLERSEKMAGLKLLLQLPITAAPCGISRDNQPFVYDRI